MEGLRKSSAFYLVEIQERSDQRKNTTIMLFISSVCLLVVALSILFPVIKNVNKARMQVLSLFVDIPNHHVIALANKCEKFLTSFNKAMKDENLSEDEDVFKVDDTDITASSENKRGYKKYAKNSEKGDKQYVNQFLVVFVIIEGYFVL